ncbi:MAG TPA: hypothetical protein VHZ51_21830 [Ktedonobacteraceae bacterium]|nr:hypothetical protein [Ktedonobacteraceae bacterium]
MTQVEKTRHHWTIPKHEGAWEATKEHPKPTQNTPVRSSNPLTLISTDKGDQEVMVNEKNRLILNLGDTSSLTGLVEKLYPLLE